MIRAFDGRLVGSQKMKSLVSETLELMEDEIIAYITSNCWFFGSMGGALAYTFTGNDLKNMHIIFLSDELFTYHKKQIMFTIAHEIGHVVLGHRNSVFEKQTKREIKLQEKEADEFANKYIRL